MLTWPRNLLLIQINWKISFLFHIYKHHNQLAVITGLHESNCSDCFILQSSMVTKPTLLLATVWCHSVPAIPGRFNYSIPMELRFFQFDDCSSHCKAWPLEKNNQNSLRILELLSEIYFSQYWWKVCLLALSSLDLKHSNLPKTLNPLHYIRLKHFQLAHPTCSL